MHTLTVKVTDQKAIKALKELEKNHWIEIIGETEKTPFSLAGKEISEEDFRKWVEYAESSTSVDLNEAVLQWEAKKQKIRHPEK